MTNHSHISSARIYRRIEEVRNEKSFDSAADKYHDRLKTLWITAACIFLLIVSSVFIYKFSFTDTAGENSLAKQDVYTTNDRQHKVLTLSDGSTVRLNSNSELAMPPVFKGVTREVTLTGEAYFEIISNVERPFIVRTDHAVIRVLGTSFNVKADSDSENVQVAVSEGKVSLRHLDRPEKEDGVVLTKNQLGYLEIGTKDIEIEQIRSDNYLSWLTGRIVFRNIPLSQVCRDLERMYDVTCTIPDENLKKINFTADFERESLAKTLKNISNSLDIRYYLKGDTVRWMKKG